MRPRSTAWSWRATPPRSWPRTRCAGGRSGSIRACPTKSPTSGTSARSPRGPTASAATARAVFDWGYLQERDFAFGASDARLLARRFRAFEGIANGPTALIESGIGRLGIDPNGDLEAQNRRTFALAADRPSSRPSGPARSATRRHVRMCARPRRPTTRRAGSRCMTRCTRSPGPRRQRRAGRSQCAARRRNRSAGSARGDDRCHGGDGGDAARACQGCPAGVAQRHTRGLAAPGRRGRAPRAGQGRTGRRVRGGIRAVRGAVLRSTGGATS